MEALYVDTLVLESTATVTVDGINIYYRLLEDNGATTMLINGGALRSICAENQPASAEFVQVVQTLGTEPFVANRTIGLTTGEPGRIQGIRVKILELPFPFDVWAPRDMWVTAPFEICDLSGQSVFIVGI